jgi:hypothetical protein
LPQRDKRHPVSIALNFGEFELADGVTILGQLKPKKVSPPAFFLV